MKRKTIKYQSFSKKKSKNSLHDFLQYRFVSLFALVIFEILILFLVIKRKKNTVIRHLMLGIMVELDHDKEVFGIVMRIVN